jgi:hypothetical protein
MNSEPATTDPPTPRSRIVATLMLVIPALLIITVIVAATVSASAAEQFLMGWLYFPLRVSSQVTIDRPAAALGIVCTISFVAILHRLLIWFAKNNPRSRAEDTATNSAEQDESARLSNQDTEILTPTIVATRWTVRSTIAVSFVVVLLFNAGIAMVGLTHQTVWLFSGRSRESSSADPPVPGLVAYSRFVAAEDEVNYHLHSVGFGAMNYTGTTRGLMPPGGTMTPDGTLMHGWAIPLGPYIDSSSFISPEINFLEPWNSPENARYYKGAIPSFLHPGIAEVFDSEGFAYSHMSANTHVFPITTQTPGVDHWMVTGRKHRGLSNIILFGMVATEFRPWGHPANVRDPSIGINQSPEGFGGPSGDGANFVMGDGSVRFISKNTDLEVLRQLSSPHPPDNEQSTSENDPR